MRDLVMTFALGSGVAGAWFAWRSLHVRRVARERFAAWTESEDHAEDVPATKSLLRRNYLWPVAAAGALGAMLYFGTSIGGWFAGAIALMVGLLLTRVDAFLLERRSLQIEEQLGTALDLLTSALQAGSSLLPALESAVAEVRAPLRGELDHVLQRIRLGGDPLEVFDQLMQRLPMETVRLFAMTLAVHWEVGGSLGPTLASVARTVRDRIELSRRMQALTMQARVTTITVLASVYFIGLMMWRNDPVRMEGFLTLPMGQILVAGCLVLQAAGIAWIGIIAKPRF